MPYFVYQITAPSGKYYIGVTKHVKNRWISHQRRVRLGTKRHPLYDSIRHYGAENFVVTTLLECQTEEEAKTTEIACIALFNATDRAVGYNISPGGEYDGATGRAEFWKRIKSDQTAYVEYINRLSEGCKKRGGLNIEALIAANRALPARERWKRSYRALRLARHAPCGRIGQNQTAPEKRQKMSEVVRKAWVGSSAAHKKRHAIACRKTAKAQWARLTSEEKTAVFGKISDTLKRRHTAEPEYHQAVTTQLKDARQNIDRSVQGPAASRGLKQFWIELKKDPERYAAHIASRTASLMATLQKKAAL